MLAVSAVGSARPLVSGDRQMRSEATMDFHIAKQPHRHQAIHPYNNTVLQPSTHIAMQPLPKHLCLNIGTETPDSDHCFRIPV